MQLSKRIGQFLSSIGSAKSSAFSFGAEISHPIGGVNLGSIGITMESFYVIWRNHADVFGCVRELSENTGSAGYKWENVNDNTKDPDVVEVGKITKILTSGKKTTFRKLKSELIKDAQITGNAFLLLQKSAGSGQVIGVERIDPRTLTAVTDEYGTILRWIQRVKVNTQVFQPDEIAQFKLTDDPNSPVFGLSPLNPIIWEVRTDLAAVVSNYAFFENDARPAAQYILEEGLSQDEQKRAIQMLTEQLKGSENRHKSIAISGVKEIKQVSVSQKDMEFHVLRKFTTEKVCATYGVPKSILNYTDDVNYSNGQEQTQKFWGGTIQPLQETLQEFFNNVVLPRCGIQKIKLVFNERTFDNREYNEQSNRLDLQLGVYTINEVREMRGFDPFDPVTHGEFVDKPMIYAGMGVRPVIDVGIDMIDAALADEAAAQKYLEMLNELNTRYEKSHKKR